MNMKKQLVCMAALCLVALQACEEVEDRVYLWSGTCGAEGDGSNLTWELVGTRSDYDHDPQACTLTISGQGEMADYNYYYVNDDWGVSPWSQAIVQVFLEPGMTNIGEYAFYGCNGLTSVTIPEGVTSIDIGAFKNCVSLSSITIPESVSRISGEAFSNCGLTSVTIPESVTSIGGKAFFSCDLTLVTIPEGVTSIEYGTFEYCSALASVTIGKGVEEIGEGAFQFCENLKEITVRAATPPAIEEQGYSPTFKGVDKDIPVYVPASSINAYINSDWGKVFSNILPLWR